MNPVSPGALGARTLFIMVEVKDEPAPSDLEIWEEHDLEVDLDAARKAHERGFVLIAPWGRRASGCWDWYVLGKHDGPCQWTTSQETARDGNSKLTQRRASSIAAGERNDK